MERIFTETECGKYCFDNNNFIVEGDSTDNGWCFKDYSAWKNNKGVIYIGEYQLLDYEQGKCGVEDLWTKENWIQWVKDEIRISYAMFAEVEEILACEEFISGLAFDCFDNADWQDLSTMFCEFDYNGDWLLVNWEYWKQNH